MLKAPGNSTTGGAGGGVTSHGALTGLDADDHPQYHNDARGDARYAPLGTAIAALAVVVFPDGRGTYERTETIVDAAVLPSTVILASLAAGSDTDENTPELLSPCTISTVSDTGSFDVTLVFSERTSGPVKLNYIKG